MVTLTSLPRAEFLPAIFLAEERRMPHLLELPKDLLRLILSSYIARSPLSHITARFVCHRFRDLLPPRPLSQETRKQARYFCKLAAAEGYLNLIKWARANCCPWDERTCSLAAWRGHLEVLQWLRPMDAHGMRRHVPMLLKVAISRCYNGCARMDVPGTSAPVTLLLNVVVSTFFNGPSQTVAHTIGISCAARKR